MNEMTQHKATQNAYILGSRLYWLCDREKISADDAGSSQERRQQIHTRRLRILIIDDEDRFRASLVYLLKHVYGAQVQDVDSGQLALEILDSDMSFDLILLDYSMPEMNGIQVYHQVRRKGCSAKVVLMSGEPGNRQLADENDLDFLEKPMKTASLEIVLADIGEGYPS